MAGYRVTAITAQADDPWGGSLAAKLWLWQARAAEKLVGGTTMRSSQRLIAASMLFLLTACASSSVQRIGPKSYAPLPNNVEVAVYTAESQVGRPFEVVGTINYTDPGKFQILSVSDAYPQLKQKAREIGANGLIIDNSSEIISGAISRGIAVDARAIYIAEFGSVTIRPIQPTTITPIAPAPMPPPLPPKPAAAQTAPSPDQSKDPLQGGKDPAQVLRDLQKLHKEGILSDREYEAKKAEVLRRM